MPNTIRPWGLGFGQKGSAPKDTEIPLGAWSTGWFVMEDEKIRYKKKATGTWFSCAAAVARRLVPTDFSLYCGKHPGTDQLQYAI